MQMCDKGPKQALQASRIVLLLLLHRVASVFLTQPLIDGSVAPPRPAKSQEPLRSSGCKAAPAGKRTNPTLSDNFCEKCPKGYEYCRER